MTIRILLFTIITTILCSCRIYKGYEALEVYNYFDAKHNFEKSLDKVTSPAAHGLSMIYYRNDNPFHNLDSAYHYSLLAVESYDQLKEKVKEKLAEDIDYTLQTAKKHRGKVSERFFEIAKEKHTVQSYREFIANHPWSELKDSATYRRDLLAFENAKEKNSTEAYRNYLRYYPESQQKDKAIEALHRAEFRETIIPGNSDSYSLFIEKYPNNPFVEEAKTRIYQLETKENTIDAYEKFIDRYPDNPYVSAAWKNLYRLYISDYNESTLNNFLEEYPEFPFPGLVQQDLQLVGRDMYLFKLRDKYGFMDEKGMPYIPAQYKFASRFSNGLAVVMKEERFGYINKNGDLIIDYRFEDAQDFNHGRAIVEENGFFGLIDPTGKYVLPPKFLDIGAYSEGVFYVQSEKGYQYYNLEGDPAFDLVFDEAFSFENGMANVSVGGENGFIGKDGNFLISTYKGKLRHFNDSIFVLELRDSMNFIRSDSTFLHDRFFHRIGNLKNKRAIVSMKDKYGYVNDSANIVIPMELNPFPNYFQFAQFVRGHTKKMVGDKFAMIDSVGKKVLPPIFTGIGDYGQLIPVTKGNQWGYTNKDVRLIIDYQYDYAYPFRDGLALVDKLGKTGVLNLNGDLVIPIRYDDLERKPNDIFVYKLGDSMGLIDSQGDALTSNVYNRVTAITENLFRLENNEKMDYYDVSKRRLITLQLENE